MKLPSWAPFALIGFGALLAYCWGRGEAPTSHAVDSLDAAVRVLRVDLAEAESVNVIRLARISQLKDSTQRARAQRQAFNMVTDSLKGVITGFDSLVPRELVDSLVRVYEIVISADSVEQSQLREQVNLWRAVALSRDTLLQSAGRALTAMQAQRDAYRKAAGKKLRCGPAIGAGIALGGGASLFAGVACLRG